MQACAHPQEAMMLERPGMVMSDDTDLHSLEDEVKLAEESLAIS
jgi:hypothetical protein